MATRCKRVAHAHAIDLAANTAETAYLTRRRDQLGRPASATTRALGQDRSAVSASQLARIGSTRAVGESGSTV